MAATFFMVSGGPYGIEDILDAGYLKGLIILLALPLLWSLPTALMIGELASALPEEGGFYVWVRRAMGPFWGYQEAWLSLAASIFDMAIYPTLFVLYLTRLFPSWTAGWHGTAWELGLIALCCVWNLLGAPAVGDGSVGARHSAPCSLRRARCRWPSGTELTLPTHSSWLSPATKEASPPPSWSRMWNYMGWDNASTVAREVDNPRRNYPRAMLASAALVAISYIVPLAAMAWAGVPADSFSTGSWADVARALVGPWLSLAIVIGGTLTAVGMFNALTMSYARLPMVLAEDRMLPSLLARKNSRSVPWVAVLACAVAWALALRFTFERLISIDLILYGSSLILEFVALIVLRLREPALDRPFRAGGLVTACVIGAIPTALIVYADVVSRHEHMAHMPALLLGALIAACGPLFYLLSRINTRRPKEEFSAAAD